jgi:hypothetical protein
MKIGEKYNKDFQYPLRNLEKFENFLYLDDNYRDHVLHTFRVWGLGLFLYRQLHNYFLLDDSQERIFKFQWYLASVYHDVGYPIKNVKKVIATINESFDYLDIKFDLAGNNSNDRKLNSDTINSHIRELVPTADFNEENDFFSENHGIISARILLFSLYDRLQNRWNENANEAIKAIILHTDKIDIQIDANPVAALLLICDELQEWGRSYQNNFEDRNKELEYIAIEIINNQSINQNFPQIYYKYPRGVKINMKKQRRKEEHFKRLTGIKIIYLDKP